MKLWKFGLRNTVKLPALYSWTGSENLTKASWCTALRKSLLLWKVTLLYYSERSAKAQINSVIVQQRNTLSQQTAIQMNMPTTSFPFQRFPIQRDAQQDNLSLLVIRGGSQERIVHQSVSSFTDTLAGHFPRIGGKECGRFADCVTRCEN